MENYLPLLLLFIFHFNSHLTSSANLDSPFSCNPHQSRALLQFISTFTVDIAPSSWRCDSPYPKTESWKEGTDCCSSWDGVTCDEVTGDLIGLDLSCSQLVGTIYPNSTLFSSHIAQSLTHLDLSSSGFIGYIPSEISLLSHLVSLDLSYSDFHGNIPSEISHFSNLISLDLSDNWDLRVESDRVLERIAQNLTRLRVLHLDYVNMSSLVQAYSALTNLSSSLTSLRLYSCGLKGQFPVSFLVRPNLQVLDLSSNKFNPVTSPPVFNSNSLTVLGLGNTNLSSVSIVFLDFVENLKSLRILDMSNCSLGGSFLPSFGKHVKLTSLDLYVNNFDGPIPASLCNMTQLLYLNLGDNQLNGTLPSCLFTLPSLETLRLNDNKLYGQIPTSLFKSVNLTILDLSSNSLSGSFDLHVLFDLKKLQYLDFHSNLLQGRPPIPPLTTMFLSASNNSFKGEISSLFCNLTSLEVLDLSLNRIIGSIPQCLGNLSNLSVLNLGTNNLRGTIPDMFSKDNTLNYLNFNKNQLRGRLPYSLSYCKNLKVLDVGHNLIEDKFPHWLEILARLQVLVLRSNKFFGSVNGFKSNSSFSSLRILDVQNNNLTGQLPIRLIDNLKSMRTWPEGLKYSGGYIGFDASYGSNYYSMILTVKGIEMKYEKILTAMAIIDFSRNKFEGDIPEVIGKLVSLKGLNLSHNYLTGHIPPSMGHLAYLEGLDLSSNKLVGQIPNELTSLGFLAFLNLSHNQLEGPIPQGKQFYTFKNDSYEENLRLCGFPLSRECKTNEQAPSENNVDSLDSVGGFSWAGAFVGYGCGIVFGVSMGYLVFSSRSPQWFVRMVEVKDLAIKRGGQRR